MSKLNQENYIWDLHIHTCRCPKGSSEFSEIDSVERYVDLIIDIFKEHHDLSMISFTDHNQINKDVYEAFKNRKTGIVVIPGIEVDAYVKVDADLTKSYKHIIIYFDEEAFDFSSHCRLINDYISSKLDNKGQLRLDELLSFLLTKIRVKFLVSPHAFKQDKRGIDFDWCSEEITNENLKQYTDQFFCFWEASGESEIAKGCKMLDDFNSERKISLISFSDSNNSEKLKAYLSKPPQYFNALPSFEGLRMVGTEPRRINRRKEKLSDSDKGKYIGFVDTNNGCCVELSPKLNVIIGGRGSGKSIFLDSIYLNHISEDKATTSERAIIDSSRIEFIRNLSFSARTLANQNLSAQFNLQYLQQNYVYDLFSNVNELEKKLCFRTYFDRLADFDIETIRRDYLQQVDSIVNKTNLNAISSNLVDIGGSIIAIQTADYFLKVKSAKVEPALQFGVPDDFINATSAPRVVPKELKNNDDFIKAQKIFFFAIQKIVLDNNISRNEDNLKFLIQNRYRQILDKKNEEQKRKSEALQEIQSRLKKAFFPYLRRSRIVARLALLQKIVKTLDKHEEIIQGVDGHKFVITKELVIEEPLYYLHKCFINNFDAKKLSEKGVKDKKNKYYLPQMISLFIESPNDILMESSNYEEMIESFESLSSWPISQRSRIYVESNGNYFNLATESPGTRANYLMEFIVSEDKSVPLLIDQPEDNIDNETIAGKLTEWFLKMKNSRQLIVVTHDPNIVVNADADNVIVCKQRSDGAFDYTNGPLEQKESLHAVVTILEGGRDALERRIGKYGK